MSQPLVVFFTYIDRPSTLAKIMRLYPTHAIHVHRYLPIAQTMVGSPYLPTRAFKTLSFEVANDYIWTFIHGSPVFK